ncbi:MAG: hypothetical protein C4533_05020 [Candidatus Omnitrophota bacterium]|jgi:hypothetical protein|nr:MAG: hypothetical protein C4533_05020 [Candidatus Omnitrophota bacterium]
MKKRRFIVRFVLFVIVAIILNGCVFIVKDGDRIRYYGIDEQRGSEHLHQISEKQREIYGPREIPNPIK